MIRIDLQNPSKILDFCGYPFIDTKFSCRHQFCGIDLSLNPWFYLYCREFIGPLLGSQVGMEIWKIEIVGAIPKIQS